MEKNPNKNSGKWCSHFEQISISSRDMEKTRAVMKKIFNAEPDFCVATPVTEKYYFGRLEGFSSVLASFSFANREFEVIQPLEGTCTHFDFINAGFRGLNHIGFATDNLPALVEKMAGKGIVRAMNGDVDNDTHHGNWAYFDVRPQTGSLMEVTNFEHNQAAMGLPPIMKLRKLADTPIPDTALNRVEQVVYVLPDMDEAIENFRTVFEEEPDLVVTSTPAKDPKDKLYYGEPSDFINKIAQYHFCDLEIEIITPVSGKSTFDDFLKTGQKGLNHVTFGVKDIDAVEKWMNDMGYRSAMNGPYYSVPGARYVLFDTLDDLGFTLKVSNLSWKKQQMAEGK